MLLASVLLEEISSNVGIGDSPVQALNPALARGPADPTKLGNDTFPLPREDIGPSRDHSQPYGRVQVRPLTMRQLKDGRTFFPNARSPNFRTGGVTSTGVFPQGPHRGAAPTLSTRFQSSRAPPGLPERSGPFSGQQVAISPDFLGERSHDSCVSCTTDPNSSHWIRFHRTNTNSLTPKYPTPETPSAALGPTDRFHAQRPND